MKIIPINSKKYGVLEIKVDDEDFVWVKDYRWSIDKAKHTFYAKRFDGTKKIYMHRYVMGFPGLQVDHINGNGLDNRKENLRVATQAQNNFNARKRKNTTSKFKGVYFHAAGKKIKRWTAGGKLGGKYVYLGRYLTEEEASKAYDSFASENYGSYARINASI